MKAKKTKPALPPEKPRGIGIQVALLCLIVFLSPLAASKMTPIPSLSVQALIFVTALIRLIDRRQISLPGRGISLSLIVLYGLFLISAIGSASIHSTLRELLNVGAYFLVFLLVVDLREDKPAVYAVLGSLALSALFVGMLGLREYLLTRSPEWRVFSTFFNPDYLSGFMALMLPVALAWYLARTSQAVSFISGLTVILVFASILLTGSRFGTVAALGGTVVFFILAAASRSIGKAQVLRLSLLIIPLLAIFMLFGRPLANRVASVKAESHSGGFRIHTWKGTLRMAEAHPIKGTGLGTFEIAYPPYAEVGFTKLAHNSYLQVAAEAGVPAALILVMLLGCVTIPGAVSVFRRDTDGEEPTWKPGTKLMMSGLLGGAAASMARNLVDSDWYVMGIGIAFWAVLGAVVAMTDSSSTAKKIRGLGITILLVGLIAITVMLIGELYFSLGNTLMATDDPMEALDSYKMAVNVDPWNAEFRRRLGKFYLLYAQASDEPSHADEAQNQLRKAIELEPGSVKNWYQLAKVYEYYPDDEKAVDAYRHALAVDRFSPQTLQALAERYEQAGRHDDAVRTWEKMLKVEQTPYEKVRAVPELVEPGYIFAHIAVAEDAEKNGDTLKAQNHYRETLLRIERYQESIKYIGAILDASGRRDIETEDRIEELRIEATKRLNLLRPGSTAR